MTPVKMSVVHDPERGAYGDCFRAVIATLLDLPIIAVPHFFETGSVDVGWRMVDTFLAGHDLAWSEMVYPGSVKINDLMAGLQFPNTYLILGGSSSRGENHVVVVLNGQIVADPGWSNRGLSGPATNGVYTVGIIVPIGMKYKP